MRILVLDVPAVDSGALSILEQFHKDVCMNASQEDEWFFVVSIPKLKNQKNVKVMRYPWIKKSWFHRLYFDTFVIKKIIDEMHIDYVFSLQNTIVRNVKIPQIMYLHQALPFVDKKYKFFENTRFWIYQNIISKIIINSAKNAESVIVQTEWFKKCLVRLGIEEDKIKKNHPQIDMNLDCVETNLKSTNHFIYPATAFSYKNHEIIIEACKILEDKGVEYKVYFTITEEDNKLAKILKDQIEKYKLKIDLIGKKNKSDLIELYQESTLLFPSYIETFGLPLLEARMLSRIIVASNTPFAKEVLENYENAYFFDAEDAEALSKYMQKVILGEIQRKDVKYIAKNEVGLYELVADIIKK